MQPNRQVNYGEDRSIGGLIKDLMQELSSLVRNEAELAKAEVSEKVAQVQSGVASLVVAAVLLLVGLIGLMEAAIYGLAQVWPRWLAALVIGGAILIIGLIAFAIGRSNLKARNLAPQRSAESMRKDKAFAQEQLR